MGAGRHVIHFGIVAAAAAFFLIAPGTVLGTQTFFFLILKYILLAISFNLVAGYIGYISFGHVAFFGIGAYMAALIARHTGFSSPFFVLLLAGGAGSALAAWVVGRALLRLKGAYFAIATLALNEALKVIVFTLPEEWAGGSFGVPVRAVMSPWGGYYSMLAAALFAYAVVHFLARSRFGVALKAIREDEEAAPVLGIDVTRRKVQAFTLSAFFMGLAGAADLQFIGYVYAEAAFNIETNVEVIAMTMLGGLGTTLGPVIGAVVLYLIEDFVWARSPFFHLIILGLVLALLVLFMKRGILGALQDRVPALRGRIK